MLKINLKKFLQKKKLNKKNQQKIFLEKNFVKIILDNRKNSAKKM